MFLQKKFRKNYILFGFLFSLLLVNSVLGAYLLFYEDEVRAEIIGSANSFTIYDTMLDFQIDTTETASENSAHVRFGTAEIMDVLVEVEDVITQDPLEDCDYVGDCELQILYNGIPYNSGDTITTNNIEEKIYVKLFCVKDSCSVFHDINFRMTRV